MFIVKWLICLLVSFSLSHFTLTKTNQSLYSRRVDNRQQAQSHLSFIISCKIISLLKKLSAQGLPIVFDPEQENLLAFSRNWIQRRIQITRSLYIHINIIERSKCEERCRLYPNSTCRQTCLFVGTNKSLVLDRIDGSTMSQLQSDDEKCIYLFHTITS